MSWIPWIVGWLSTAPSPPDCVVHVEGMPAPQLRHHQVQLGGERRRAASVLQLPRAGNVVELLGPRYSGRVSLPASCSAPVILDALPRPATIELAGAPSNAVVSCSNCPGIDPDANYLSSGLPAVETDAWAIRVVFVVRAAGYLPSRLEVPLHPGANVFDIEMRLR